VPPRKLRDPCFSLMDNCWGEAVMAARTSMSLAMSLRWWTAGRRWGVCSIGMGRASLVCSKRIRYRSFRLLVCPNWGWGRKEWTLRIRIARLSFAPWGRPKIWIILANYMIQQLRIYRRKGQDNYIPYKISI